ncbi:Retrovirus-related Pol polyprotein from transposon TNT 1-94 [Eumeta japonica]|uniref:Retrovirus-related Pol polyprotein from transposon TNT 1-94 n=1 Tax=Eumeta variegata TaxID=151549 RepID=A0A4C1WV03_EUMVA|nr:Retrovirus-related Pol polyprotein from transposon TNT 1-94 [Eumeta japonica]
MTAAHKLRNIKSNVDDEWLGTLMLAGLPEMYKPMIMALESSGSSMHMTMHRDWLTNITPSSVPSIRIANNKVLKVECCGNVYIKVNAKDGSTDFIQVTFWPEAVATAAYIVDRSPTCTLLDATPYEVWTGKKPNLSHTRIFGCPAMVLIPKENRTKLDVKSRKLIFVGYSDSTKGYRFLDPETKKGVLSRDVVFLEASIKRNKVDKVPKKEKEISKKDIEIEENTKENFDEVIEKKTTYLPLCDELEEPVERSIDDDINDRIQTQAESQSICSSDDDQFEDVNDDTYLPDKTLDSPPVSNITLRPLPRRMKRHNSDENDIHPSSLMCQNVELTINLLNSDPQSFQEALNSEKADEWLTNTTSSQLFLDMEYYLKSLVDLQPFSV